MASFPLGGGGEYAGLPKVVDDPTVQAVADELGATPTQVGLAWQLVHAPYTMTIIGTSSGRHLQEDVAAGDIVLDPAHHGPARRRGRREAAGRSQLVTTTITRTRIDEPDGVAGDTVDGGGRFLEPGLIDTHAHLGRRSALRAGPPRA